MSMNCCAEEFDHLREGPAGTWALHVQKVVKIFLLHGVDTDTLIVFEQASYRVTQRAVQTPLGIKRVGLTLCTWGQRLKSKTKQRTGSFREVIMASRYSTVSQSNFRLTTSQQVLDQLLMATETSVIPEKQELLHKLHVTAAELHRLPKNCTHKGVLSHLSLTLRSTSLCSTRYLGGEKKGVMTVFRHHVGAGLHTSGWKMDALFAQLHTHYMHED